MEYGFIMMSNPIVNLNTQDKSIQNKLKLLTKSNNIKLQALKH